MGTPVPGNRHHYFHLDPDDPNETLRRHEQAGFLYDSSVIFEAYPGFRRGICHPFHPFHAGERRELRLVEVPPSLMDDHFGRRLANNRVSSPDACALELLDVARATGGAVTIDYHPRGMNADFYPQYGQWLVQFLSNHADESLSFPAPGELAQGYLAYEAELDSSSRDLTE